MTNKCLTRESSFNQEYALSHLSRRGYVFNLVIFAMITNVMNPDTCICNPSDSYLDAVQARGVESTACDISCTTVLLLHGYLLVDSLSYTQPSHRAAFFSSTSHSHSSSPPPPQSPAEDEIDALFTLFHSKIDWQNFQYLQQTHRIFHPNTTNHRTPRYHSYGHYKLGAHGTDQSVLPWFSSIVQFLSNVSFSEMWQCLPTSFKKSLSFILVGDAFYFFVIKKLIMDDI